MNDDLRWQAVQERDARADGTFVYAVRSTHIYCRPSCGSRRPKREHVTFFAVPHEAEAAGYRPCRRCQPNALIEPAAALAQQACRYIEGYGDGIPTLEELGAYLHMSPFHVQRMFKRIMGISPRQYGAALRQRQFKAQMKAGAPVTEAIYAAGFRSSSRAYAPGEGQLGMTPTIYRRGGK
ncbi:MAG TPA: bifunctional transcriptional activator/DNA repair enzyme AdaA, partial [Ktedonobacterales bacterium]|nr:bifunctional transcriptional activator/DNA repair enzyme AdaA [Ktedonobacterales bacterium]